MFPISSSQLASLIGFADIVLCGSQGSKANTFGVIAHLLSLPLLTIKELKVGSNISFYAVRLRHLDGRYDMAGIRKGKKGKVWSSVGAFKAHLVCSLPSGDWRLTPEERHQVKLNALRERYNGCIVEEAKVILGKSEIRDIPFLQWLDENHWESK